MIGQPPAPEWSATEGGGGGGGGGGEVPLVTTTVPLMTNPY